MLKLFLSVNKHPYPLFRLITFLAVYANQASDLFVCADGFGFLDGNISPSSF